MQYTGGPRSTRIRFTRIRPPRFFLRFQFLIQHGIQLVQHGFSNSRTRFFPIFFFKKIHFDLVKSNFALELTLFELWSPERLSTIFSYTLYKYLMLSIHNTPSTPMGTLIIMFFCHKSVQNLTNFSENRDFRNRFPPFWGFSTKMFLILHGFRSTRIFYSPKIRGE